VANLVTDIIYLTLHYYNTASTPLFPSVSQCTEWNKSPGKVAFCISKRYGIVPSLLLCLSSLLHVLVNLLLQLEICFTIHLCHF